METILANWHLIAFGALGGLVIKLLELYELTKIPRSQHPVFREWPYWLPFILLPIFGALLVVLYVAEDVKLTIPLAFNLGISAPLTLRALANAASPGEITVDPDA